MQHQYNRWLKNKQCTHKNLWWQFSFHQKMYEQVYQSVDVKMRYFNYINSWNNYITKWWRITYCIDFVFSSQKHAVNDKIKFILIKEISIKANDMVLIILWHFPKWLIWISVWTLCSRIKLRKTMSAKSWSRNMYIFVITSEI